MKTDQLTTVTGQKAVDRLNWIDFYGKRFYSSTGYQAGRDSTLLVAGYDELQSRIRTVANALKRRIDEDADYRAKKRKELGGIAVLGDCGLPRVDKFGGAARQFAESFRHTKSLTFTAMSMESIGSVLPDGAMSFNKLPGFLTTVYDLFKFRLFGVFATGPTQFDENQFEYLNLITNLTSTDWQRTAAWTFGRSENWQEQLGDELGVYLSDLFSGNFVDRNGTQTSFDLGVDLTDFSGFDDLQVSPQVAGKIVSVLVEFLFDILLPVPFYSKTILGTYRDYRAADPDIRAKNEDQLKKLVEAGESIRASEKLYFLEMALETGTLSPVVAGVLGIPFDREDSPHAFDFNSQLGHSPALSDDWSRIALRRLVSADSEYVASLLRRSSLNKLLDQVKGKSSSLQKSFTCFRGTTILGHLHCIFIDQPVGMDGDLIDPTWFEVAERPDGCEKPPCDCRRDGAIGATSGQVDYSDLVGRIIRFVGKTTEKNARSVAGGLVRGVSIASLDNEVVAEVVATAFATASRKSAEWATFQVLTWWITDKESTTEDKSKLLRDVAELLGFLENED